MWKESYRLGVDKIDRQHMELFAMTANLMETIKKSDINNRKEECREAIIFLKNYSLEHFVDEEEYQKSIRYAGFTAHRQLHQEFAANVLKHESKIISSDFDMIDIENFIGMLTAWLAYHVADADQKIIGDKNPQKILMECFYTAICYSLDKMVNLNKKDVIRMNNRDDFKGDIAVSTVLTGDISGTVEYVFTNEFVLKLFKSFLFMSPKSMDSLVCSILLEIANTISKNAVAELTKVNVCCNLETSAIKLDPPFLLTEDFFILDTSIGKIKTGICV